MIRGAPIGSTARSIRVRPGFGQASLRRIRVDNGRVAWRYMSLELTGRRRA